MAVGLSGQAATGSVHLIRGDVPGAFIQQNAGYVGASLGLTSFSGLFCPDGWMYNYCVQHLLSLFVSGILLYL